ncbi:hypothetical protein [Rhizohabitans arisaemae]|uniref:hypothetical protein n=1 Tax=Rhizohabitans arisaemae TaxID=2720610 RepID=UPI0024B1511F|nr:hypothetical protein [Rhizohabitans arisaemae]
MADETGATTPESPSNPGWSARQPPPYDTPWSAPGTAPADTAPNPGGPSQWGPPPGHPGPPYRHQGPPQAPRPGVIPLRPLGLGDILDGTIKTIRANPAATLGLSAVVAAVGAVPLVLTQAYLENSLNTTLAVDADADVDAALTSLVVALAGLAVSILVQAVAATMLTGLLITVLGRSVFGEKIGIAEAWRVSLRRMAGLVGYAFLSLAISVAPLLLFIGGFVLWAQVSGFSAVMVPLMLLALLVFLAWYLFIWARLSLTAPAIMQERIGIIPAMRRSWTLTSGDSWRVLGILILTSLLVSVVGSAFALPFTLAGGFAVAAGGVTISAVLSGLGSVIYGMLGYPVIAGVTGLLYTDRRMRAEGFDLVLQTAAAERAQQGLIREPVDDLWVKQR